MTTTRIDVIKGVRALEDTRFVFNGIYYHDTRKEVVATDGRMLVVGKDDGDQIYLKALAGKILHPESLSEIEGTFPNYESIIEDVKSKGGKKYRFFFPGQKKVANDPLYLYGKKGGYDPLDPVENLVPSLEIDETRQESQIVAMLNGKYLNKAFVKASKNEVWGIEMTVSNANSPIFFKLIDSKGDYQWENLEFVLMPMKLEGRK